jgi:hypothetical protein
LLQTRPGKNSNQPKAAFSTVKCAAPLATTHPLGFTPIISLPSFADHFAPLAHTKCNWTLESPEEKWPTGPAQTRKVDQRANFGSQMSRNLLILAISESK